MKIISFSGSCGSGKTSLAEDLVKKYPDRIGLCDEGTHISCEAFGVKNPGEILDKDRDKFQEMILNHHINTLKNKRDNEILITDRTIYDIFSYTLYYHDNVSDCLRNKIYEYCSLFSKTDVYDKIIYFPILDNINLDDGFRSGNKSKNKYVLFDYIIKGIYKNFDINYVSFTKESSIEDRVKIFEILYL